MPWTSVNYPNSMKNLNERVRNKAIDIANALMREDYDEGRAIAIAIAQAKQWSTRVSDAETDYHVVPHPDGWAVRREGAERASFVTSDKEEARSRAIELAAERDVFAIIHAADGKIDHFVKR